MRCRTTGYFLDLPLMLGCGDQLCQIFAASTRRLRPQKFDLTKRIRHHKYVKYSSVLGESFFEDKMLLPS